MCLPYSPGFEMNKPLTQLRAVSVGLLTGPLGFWLCDFADFRERARENANE